jgi:hypothetical protein
MEMHLEFSRGNLHGEGKDDVGQFLIKGRYDVPALQCYWTKSYLGAHDVSYRGFREGKGIWGTWEITPACHGGFQIWPYGESEFESLAESEPVPAQLEQMKPAVVEETS